MQVSIMILSCCYQEYRPIRVVSRAAIRRTGTILSGTAQYALRAVVHLAGSGAKGPVTALQLAQAADVPANYMGKILHELARSGVLKSARGKRGGFELAVSPHELPLLAVVAPFDHMGEDRRCLLGRPQCSDSDPCATHERWGEVSRKIHDFFRTTTVADVLKTGAT